VLHHSRNPRALLRDGFAMPRWPPLHPDYVGALAALARMDVSYAEALRRLIPVANRLGEPRPSYWLVRRFLRAERAELERRRAERRRLAEDVFVDMMKGLSPLRRLY
jgi:hypothetical protein